MWIKTSKAQKKERGKHFHSLILLFETLAILIFFNASSYFRTTAYSRSIDYVGIALTIFLLSWIWVNSRFRFGYKMTDLGLTTRSVPRMYWRLILAIAFLLYFVAFVTELIFPSRVRVEVTPTDLLLTAVFTLTFGPTLEELLFRGYIYRRSQDAFHFKSGSEISIASVFSGLAFGFWHLPTPIILLYFHDSIVRVYENLLVLVLVASVMGIVLGEMRRRTESILPGAFLHFCANSIYVITVALRAFLA